MSRLKNTFVMKINVESEESHRSKHLLFITKQCIELSRNTRFNTKRNYCFKAEFKKNILLAFHRAQCASSNLEGNYQRTSGGGGHLALHIYIALISDLTWLVDHKCDIFHCPRWTDHTVPCSTVPGPWRGCNQSCSLVSLPHTPLSSSPTVLKIEY